MVKSLAVAVGAVAVAPAATATHLTTVVNSIHVTTVVNSIHLTTATHLVRDASNSKKKCSSEARTTVGRGRQLTVINWSLSPLRHGDFIENPSFEDAI